MASDLLRGFYIGDLLVDPLKGHVTGQAGSIHLPPKAMEVLLCLAENPGDLVTRESLIETVWGAGHGSSEALSHAVSEIRHALDDHAEDPAYVQTLPKRGYRLVVGVESPEVHSATVVMGATGGASVADIGLFENLKARGVLETALAYLIVGWLLIQVADIVFGQLHLPTWAATFITVLVIAGFPIAVILSWFLEFRDGRAVVDTTVDKNRIRRRFSRTYVSVIGALAIAAVFVYAFDKTVGLPRADKKEIADVSSDLPPIEDSSIAVLPLMNLDGTEQTQIFADGLVDDVITRLSRVPGLLVSSRGDSFSLDPNTASARVRERLRVARYLEGSVQIENEQIRVVVQLIDSATGFHVLSRTFDRPLKAFFEMRDDITRLTVANVRVALPADTRVELPGASTDPSLDVYVLYRRGINASRLPGTEEVIETSLGWFDAALEIDPDYAAAHAGKCAVNVEAYTVTADSAYIDVAEASCATALNLNPKLDVVFAALGDLYKITGRNDAAEKAYLDAIDINPGSVVSFMGLGEVYRLQQRPDEAEASIRQAAGLQPGNWAPYNALGTFMFRSGRYTEAADQYRNVVELDDSNVQGYTNLGSALMLAGSFSEAEPAFERAIDLAPRPNTYASLGMLLYYSGRFGDSVAAHRNALKGAQQDYLNRSNLGDALWAAGNRSEAVAEFNVAENLALQASDLNPNDPYIHMDLAWINAMLDNNEQARRLIEQSLSAVPKDPYVHYINGLILNRVGNVEGALAALETAIDLGYSAELLAADPNLSALREDSRFISLLALTN